MILDKLHMKDKEGLQAQRILCLAFLLYTFASQYWG